MDYWYYLNRKRHCRKTIAGFKNLNYFKSLRAVQKNLGDYFLPFIDAYNAINKPNIPRKVDIISKSVIRGTSLSRRFGGKHLHVEAT